MSTLEELQEQLPLLVDQLIQKGIMTVEEGDTLFRTIIDANLPLGEMNKLISDLANEAGLPIVTNTVEKVAAWRKIIISLMLAGITGVTLESIIPGIYYTLYEKISTTIILLLRAGYNNQQIREFINNSPTVTIPPMPDTSGLMTGLTNGLKTGFFIAASVAVGCMNILCNIAQKTINQLTIDNFNYTARLAAQLAVPSGISYAFQVLRGDYDMSVAEFIDTGGIQEILRSANDTVSDVKIRIAEEIAESAINVNNMSLGITWTDVAPDRMLEPSINSLINREIEREIEQMMANPQNIVSKTEILNDILNVLRSDDKLSAITEFKAKYQTISKTMPKLLELLTAKAAELRVNFESHSQPTQTAVARRNNTRMSASLPSDFGFTPEEEGSRNVLHRRNPNFSSFDVVTNRAGLQDLGILSSGKKEAKKTWNKDSDRFLYEFINVWLNDKDPRLVEKLISLSSENYNLVINKIIEMARDRGGYDVASSVDDTVNRDRSYEELHNIFKTITPTIRGLIQSKPSIAQEDLSGGRYKKSRHYKRKRMTQRKRTIQKKRMTQRKGKKRRSTKRKR